MSAKKKKSCTEGQENFYEFAQPGKAGANWPFSRALCAANARWGCKASGTLLRVTGANVASLMACLLRMTSPRARSPATFSRLMLLIRSWQLRELLLCRRKRNRSARARYRRWPTLCSFPLHRETTILCRWARTLGKSN